MLLITSTSSIGMGGFRQFIENTNMTPAEYMANITIKEVIALLKYNESHVAECFKSSQIEHTSSAKFFDIPEGVSLQIITNGDKTIDVLIQDIELIAEYREG